jgi:hypothetical protein
MECSSSLVISLPSPSILCLSAPLFLPVSHLPSTSSPAPAFESFIISPRALSFRGFTDGAEALAAQILPDGILELLLLGPDQQLQGNLVWLRVSHSLGQCCAANTLFFTHGATAKPTAGQNRVSRDRVKSISLTLPCSLTAANSP